MAEMEKISRGTCLLSRMVTGGLQKKGLSKAEITTIAAFIRSLGVIIINFITIYLKHLRVRFTVSFNICSIVELF